MDGDTYSYGMVLLEMFTGRRPTGSFIDGVANLISFVKMAYSDHLLEILDTLFR
jgi:serine/threonine protein kinase